MARYSYTLIIVFLLNFFFKLVHENWYFYFNLNEKHLVDIFYALNSGRIQKYCFNATFLFNYFDLIICHINDTCSVFIWGFCVKPLQKITKQCIDSFCKIITKKLYEYFLLLKIFVCKIGIWKQKIINRY